MRFHVDYDEGSILALWVVPDNPRASSRIYVFVDHVFRGLIASNDDRPLLRDWGWHVTGQVAFMLDDEILPGLAAAAYVEVYDVDSLVLVYRRAPPEGLREGKLLRYTTGLVPEAALDRAVFDRYRLSYTRVENIPEETLGGLFDYRFSQSVYISGRISARKIRNFVEKNDVMTCAVLDDPFRLLSRHILWLRSAAAVADDESRGWRVADIAELIAFARSLDLGDAKSLRRAIAALEGPAFDLLCNPVTRQFGCSEKTDEIANPQYANALEEISHLTVIGHSDHYEAFVDSLSGTIGCDIGAVEAPSGLPGEEELALTLSRLKPAQELVGYDVMLAEAVEQAVREQWLDKAEA